MGFTHEFDPVQAQKWKSAPRNRSYDNSEFIIFIIFIISLGWFRDSPFQSYRYSEIIIAFFHPSLFQRGACNFFLAPSRRREVAAKGLRLRSEGANFKWGCAPQMAGWFRLDNPKCMMLMDFWADFFRKAPYRSNNLMHCNTVYVHDIFMKSGSQDMVSPNMEDLPQQKLTTSACAISTCRLLDWGFQASRFQSPKWSMGPRYFCFSRVKFEYQAEKGFPMLAQQKTGSSINPNINNTKA